MGSTCCKDKEIAPLPTNHISYLSSQPSIDLQHCYICNTGYNPRVDYHCNTCHKIIQNGYSHCCSSMCRCIFRQDNKHCSTCHVTWNDFTQYHICKWNKIYSVGKMCCHHCGDEYDEGKIHECDISRIVFEDVKISPTKSKNIELQYKSIIWNVIDSKNDKECIICLDAKKCVSLKCCQNKQSICLDCIKEIEKKSDHLFICPTCNTITPITEIVEIEKINKFA